MNMYEQQESITHKPFIAFCALVVAWIVYCNF